MAAPLALEHIAVAVTPAVMVSACGLVALGLANQVGGLPRSPATVLIR